MDRRLLHYQAGRPVCPPERVRSRADIWWQGCGELAIRKAAMKLETLLKDRDAPEFIILHVGGNDIGSSKVKTINEQLRKLMAFVDENMPQKSLSWSSALSHNSGSTHYALHRARKIINYWRRS